MFTTLFSLSLVLTFVHFVLAQSGFTIYTPTVVQCQSAQLNWTDTGHVPYDLLIVSANDPCGPALEDLGNQTSTSVNWTVDFPVGTRVVLSLMDAVGAEAWSGTITVGNSSDTSCLKSTPSSPTPSVSGPASTTTTSPPKSSTLSPAGAAGAGVINTSGALSMCPFSIVTLLGSAVLAVVAFTL